MAINPISALETINDYIDDARILMMDTIAPYRYSDESLITGMNVAILEGRRLRADLFVYNCPKGKPPQFIAKDGTEFDMEDQFRLAFLHGMIAHALERDQEDLQDARAMAFMNIFNTILTGRGAPAVSQPRQQQVPMAQSSEGGQ